MENSSMLNHPTPTGQPEAWDFAKQANLNRPGFINELWIFVRYNKRWWLTPIILLLLFVGLIIVLGGTAAAPFIYTLF
jgi:hypothetical protein